MMLWKTGKTQDGVRIHGNMEIRILGSLASPGAWSAELTKHRNIKYCVVQLYLSFSCCGAKWSKVHFVFSYKNNIQRWEFFYSSLQKKFNTEMDATETCNEVYSTGIPRKSSASSTRSCPVTERCRQELEDYDIAFDVRPPSGTNHQVGDNF